MKPNKSKREKSTTTAGHYVRNADLLPVVIEAKRRGEVTNDLILMIQLIANNYSKKWRFANYSYREDMVSSAVENLCKNALKFDAEKYTNPFSYYTSAIHNSFLQYISDEKKHRTLRDKLLIDAGVNPSFGFNENGEPYDSDLASFESGAADNHDGASFAAVEETPEDASDDSPAEDKDDSTVENEKSAYDRIGDRDKAPGRGISLKASEVYLDPIRGIYVRKAAEELQS